MIKKIINNEIDNNSPNYDIYYILEDLQQFYNCNEKWKRFKGIGRNLKWDTLIITLFEGKMSYKVNETQLDLIENIPFQDNKEVYLLVHDRYLTSKCNINYITELFQ